jgi:hypothetical protein
VLGLTLRAANVMRYYHYVSRTMIPIAFSVPETRLSKEIFCNVKMATNHQIFLLFCGLPHLSVYALTQILKANCQNRYHTEEITWAR